jgi:hypothetical protein
MSQNKEQGSDKPSAFEINRQKALDNIDNALQSGLYSHIIERITCLLLVTKNHLGDLDVDDIEVHEFLEAMMDIHTTYESLDQRLFSKYVAEPALDHP